jgi:hypothetical protein
MVERADRRLVCLATGSDLAPRAQAELEAIVENPERSIEPAQNPHMRWGCQWFCPADGLPLRETTATLVCDECGRMIPAGLIYQLVELNPHP